MEYDGFLSFRATLTAKQDMEIEDIALEIPYRRKDAAYMMGLGCEGGFRPASWDWNGIRRCRCWATGILPALSARVTAASSPRSTVKKQDFDRPGKLG